VAAPLDRQLRQRPGPQLQAPIDEPQHPAAIPTPDEDDVEQAVAHGCVGSERHVGAPEAGVQRLDREIRAGQIAPVELELPPHPLSGHQNSAKDVQRAIRLAADGLGQVRLPASPTHRAVVSPSP